MKGVRKKLLTSQEDVPSPRFDCRAVDGAERSDTSRRLNEIRKSVFQLVEAVQHDPTALQVQVQKTILPDHIQELKQKRILVSYAFYSVIWPLLLFFIIFFGFFSHQVVHLVRILFRWTLDSNFPLRTMARSVSLRLSPLDHEASYCRCLLMRLPRFIVNYSNNVLTAI